MGRLSLLGLWACALCVSATTDASYPLLGHHRRLRQGEGPLPTRPPGQRLADFMSAFGRPFHCLLKCVANVYAFLRFADADQGHQGRRAVSTFSINIRFNSAMSAANRAVFLAAKTTWESLLTGYAPGINYGMVTINAAVISIDGPGNILGQVWHARARSMPFAFF
jgi:hypothetical protein